MSVAGAIRRPADALLRAVELEAAGAGAAAPLLTDESVLAALRRAAELLRERSGKVLDATRPTSRLPGTSSTRERSTG